MKTDPADILARIEERLRATGKSARTASIEAGSANIIPSIRRGSAPPVATIGRLALALDTSPAYLGFGIDPDEVPDELVRAASFPPIASVPILGEVAAGRWRDTDTAIDASPFEGIAVPPNPAYPIEHQEAFIVRGTSINRDAADGAILNCVNVERARISPRTGELVIAEQSRYDGQEIERTAKRYRPVRDGVELWPNSTDPQWREPLFVPAGGEDGSTRISVRAIVTWVHAPLDAEMPWRK